MKNGLLNKYIPHFQPIADLKSQEIIMHECLARFIDNDGSAVGPKDVSVLFSDSHFLYQLFEATLPIVFARAGDDTRISINISSPVLTDAFLLKVRNLASRSPETVKNIYFEIPETDIANDYAILSKKIAELRECGYGITLDDFGSGLINSRILKENTFDVIKISGKLLTNASKSNESMSKLEGVAKILLGYKSLIVAKHIETECISELAQKAGIRYGQGYYLSSPSATIRDRKKIESIHGHNGDWRWNHEEEERC